MIMKKFYIISNKIKDEHQEYAERIKKFLTEQGAFCECQDFSKENVAADFRYTDAALIPKDTECIIVLGGDGTLLQASIDLNCLDIPLFGVNLGTLGFLTDTDMENVEEALLSILNGEYEIDVRMMLDGCVYRKGEVIYESVALNDIVINRCGNLRVINFDVIVNDEYLSSYSADGVIVATPTGSTAYSLSAGGPILQPNAQLMMITPICPHTLNMRSIIFDSNDTITIVMRDDRGIDEERVASFDGEEFCRVVTDDKIVIKKSDRVSKFIKTNKASFLQRVREKMM